jgi:TRAP-type C4-dicarboxylate transport system permease small subunit
MRDRSLAIILTVIAVLLFGCPGLTVLCLGITGFIVFYSTGYQSYNVSPGWVNGVGTLGICLGIFLIVITIIAAFFLLRRKSHTLPAAPNEPLPPTKPDEPIPPSI